MQTIDFLKTAKWIVNIIGDDVRTIFFSDELYMLGRNPVDPKFIDGFINAAHGLSRGIEQLHSHPHATLILKAFGVERLLDRNFPVELSVLLLRQIESDRPPEERLVTIIRPLMKSWRTLISCIEPIEMLTIPVAVRNEVDFDDLLTLELRYGVEANPKVETLSSVLSSVSRLYNAMIEIYKVADPGSLAIIYADSGSSIRLDFKGLGEPIHRIKELLVEAWNLVRHRKSEDFRHNNKALLEGLESVSQIQRLRESGSLGQEDASRLSRQIVDSALSLFEAGVLPREVHRSEVISNQTLLAGLQPKLLPPAPEHIASTREASVSKSRPSRPSKLPGRKRPKAKPR